MRGKKTYYFEWGMGRISPNILVKKNTVKSGLKLGSKFREKSLLLIKILGRSGEILGRSGMTNEAIYMI